MEATVDWVGRGTGGTPEPCVASFEDASGCALLDEVETLGIPGAEHGTGLPSLGLAPTPSLAIHVEELGSEIGGARDTLLEPEMAASGDPGTGL